MTLGLLSIQDSVQLNSSGNGTITLRPDTGQFWLPISVHIGTRNQSPTLSGYSGVSCALYAGGPPGALSVNNAFLVDNTAQGSNDTSTILSGQIVSPGQAVVCRFLNGFPSDTAFVQLSGLVSDVPPAMGIVPSIPGARFLGSATVETESPFAWRPTIVLQPFNITIGAGATNGGFGAGPSQRFFLHTMQIIDITGVPNIDILTSPGGVLLASLRVPSFGADPVAGVIPQLPMLDFRGAPLTIISTRGQGFAFRNNAGVSHTYVGYYTVSVTAP